MRRSLFHFDLPEDLIAQHPAPERDGARLLVVDAPTGQVTHRTIRELADLVAPNTLFVPNDVKVRHARLFLRRTGGGVGEALLLRAFADGAFEAMVRPGSRLKPGRSASVVDPITGAVHGELLVEDTLDEGLRRVRVLKDGLPLDWDAVDRIGRLPLPPYIRHIAAGDDETRYQTTFHGAQGEAVAAPTAGLHFTPELIKALKEKGCGWAPVRLHVGLGTFRPMSAEDTDHHVMHEERFEVSPASAAQIEIALRFRKEKLLAVGTTALRTLEAAWDGERLHPSGATRIFIQPGVKLRTADHLLTNFHLPESTLFVLICALLGLEQAHATYIEAIRERYRFFSYGDAMLILNLRTQNSGPGTTNIR